MTTIKDIKAKIASMLQALPEIKEVIDHPTSDFTKYPAAVATITGGTGQVLDTHRNERTFNFVIRLYQEQSENGKDKYQADQILTDAADAVILAFDQNRDLDGSVEIVRVLEFEINYTQTPGTYNFATFKVEAVVIVPNYS